MIINVNNLKIYYEKAGQGPPLLLLHGNGESHAVFAPLIKSLQSSFTIFAPDSRGHGQSEYAPMDYFLMAEDVYSFIKALGIKKPHIFGYSDGGITALLLASSHPECLSSLIAAGANLRVSAFKKRIRLLMELEYLFKRDEKLRLMLKQPPISAKTLSAITARSLILAGEKDVFPFAHTLEIKASIKQAQLLIQKGKNHYNYVHNTDMLAPIISEFCLNKHVRL